MFDEAGVSRFGLLQTALGSAPEQLSFVVFDLLYLNGRDLRELPLSTRKDLLATVLGDLPPGSPLRFADHVVDGVRRVLPPSVPAAGSKASCASAPRVRIRPGRGRDWQKVKCRLRRSSSWAVSPRRRLAGRASAR